MPATSNEDPNDILSWDHTIAAVFGTRSGSVSVAKAVPDPFSMPSTAESPGNNTTSPASVTAPELDLY
eukprot:gene43892-54540_t